MEHRFNISDVDHVKIMWMSWKALDGRFWIFHNGVIEWDCCEFVPFSIKNRSDLIQTDIAMLVLILMTLDYQQTNDARTVVISCVERTKMFQSQQSIRKKYLGSSLCFHQYTLWKQRKWLQYSILEIPIMKHLIIFWKMRIYVLGNWIREKMLMIQ